MAGGNMTRACHSGTCTTWLWTGLWLAGTNVAVAVNSRSMFSALLIPLRHPHHNAAPRRPVQDLDARGVKLDSSLVVSALSGASWLCTQRVEQQ